MKKMFATCLVVAHVLVGCGVSPVFNVESPTRERTIGKGTNSQQRQVLPMDKVQKGTYLGKDDPARHGLTMLKPAANATRATASSADVVAPEGSDTASTTTDVSAEAPGYLSLESGPKDFSIVPIRGDAGELERLMFSPTDGNLRWEVSAKQGPVALKKLRLTLQSTAEFPPPIIQEFEASVASDAESAMPGDRLVAQESDPITVDLETTSLNWPSTLKVDMRTQLAFNLKTNTMRDFLATKFNTARVKLTLEFLDDAGNPVLDDQGEAFVLKQTIQVN